MKKGIKTIITGSVLFILGTFVIPFLCVIPLFPDGSKDVQFKVPGTIQAVIDKPGRYYLWNDYRTIYKGKSYNRSESIPDGLEIKIKDSNGKLLDFVCNSYNSTYSGDNARKSIGYVETKNVGKVDIEVSGGNEERIFSFSSSSNLLKIIVLFFGSFAIAALFALAGVGITIWGIVKLVNANKKDGQATPLPH